MVLEVYRTQPPSEKIRQSGLTRTEAKLAAKAIRAQGIDLAAICWPTADLGKLC